MTNYYIGESTLCDEPITYFVSFRELLLEIDCYTSRQIRVVEILLKQLNLKVYEKEDSESWHYITIHSSLKDMQNVIKSLGSSDDVRNIDDITEDYVLEKLRE